MKWDCTLRSVVIAVVGCVTAAACGGSTGGASTTATSSTASSESEPPRAAQSTSLPPLPPTSAVPHVTLPTPVTALEPAWSAEPIEPPPQLDELAVYWYEQDDWNDCVMLAPTAPLDGSSGLLEPFYLPGSSGVQPPISWPAAGGSGAITQEVIPAGKQNVSSLNDLIDSGPAAYFFRDGSLELIAQDGSQVLFMLPGEPCFYLFTFDEVVPHVASSGLLGTLAKVASPAQSQV